MIILNIWENKIDVPNHQPEMECFLTQPGHPMEISPRHLFIFRYMATDLFLSLTCRQKT